MNPIDISAEAASVAAWTPPTREERRAKWAEDIAEMRARYPRVNANDVQPGMPATYYIGSDSYAMMVTEVERFKTGAKAGQVKAVWVQHADVAEDGSLIVQQRYDWIFPADGEPQMVASRGDRFVARDRTFTERQWPEDEEWPIDVQVTETRFYGTSDGRVAYWSSLAVGWATDYRDPSF